ncbi:MAG: carbon storage regulator CsrA [Pirellulales bacterium]|jgi:carbon storage regulator|nr:carbon storage regulator CsrA [Pirellulales bacterium]MDA7994117.1 carbon storage regulator CsrA [Pirellulales bacterium]MDA9718219.1 carbon storage regulator CsrA [Planctomycetaceae bacterium]MEC7294503.1 carbon storage regulator CsrA [Planctomycetota bacterium]MEE2797771.1 carbon storage regulator CsrA [Planctomycetota bacterium]|tara:strand:- start:756 stop:1010 length:255 start_codon:yes stop_codon:yes gene_type:complete
MLVLSRKKDESVVINNNIRIVVVEIRGDKVRLGVEAPKEVPVHRSEVYEAINSDDPDKTIPSVNNVPQIPESCEPADSSGLVAD